MTRATKSWACRLLLGALVLGSHGAAMASKDAVTDPPKATASRAGDPQAPLTTVAAVDLARYLGTWHEIAKFPNWFQRRCASDTRAVYSLREDGTLRVDNACRDAKGEPVQAIGTARRLGPAKFEVRFAPEWLAFLPMVWGDYWVVDIDPAYTLVAVSEPRRKYLWVLSRTPLVAPDAYEALLARLAAQGLDVSQLERTPQTSPLR